MSTATKSMAIMVAPLPSSRHEESPARYQDSMKIPARSPRVRPRVYQVTKRYPMPASVRMKFRP